VLNGAPRITGAFHDPDPDRAGSDVGPGGTLMKLTTSA
jgi:hypothetical protein